MADEIKKTRKSRILRGLKRTLQTAEYESLVIEIGFEEEIEWTTLVERQKKIDNWNTLLIKDFKSSSDRILEELGITHKKAYFKNPSAATIEKYSVSAKSSAEASVSSKSLDLDDLDSLDTSE